MVFGRRIGQRQPAPAAAPTIMPATGPHRSIAANAAAKPSDTVATPDVPAAPGVPPSPLAVGSAICRAAMPQATAAKHATSIQPVQPVQVIGACAQSETTACQQARAAPSPITRFSSLAVVCDC